MIVVPPSFLTSMPEITLENAAASFKLRTCTIWGSVPGGPEIIRFLLKTIHIMKFKEKKNSVFTSKLP